MHNPGDESFITTNQNTLCKQNQGHFVVRNKAYLGFPLALLETITFPQKIPLKLLHSIDFQSNYQHATRCLYSQMCR